MFIPIFTGQGVLLLRPPLDEAPREVVAKNFLHNGNE
jgi:hypothetical protein